MSTTTYKSGRVQGWLSVHHGARGPKGLEVGYVYTLLMG